VAKSGPPSKYKEAYNNEVIEYLAQGYSVAAFAGHIGVDKTTVFDWLKKYPEFAASYQIAKGKSLAFWEGLLIAAAKGETKAAPAVLIFGVKNRGPEEWRDVQSLEHSGKDGKPIKTQEVSSREKLFDLVTRVSKRERETTDHSGTTH
jgi:hypothetical protein